MVATSGSWWRFRIINFLSSCHTASEGRRDEIKVKAFRGLV